MDKEKTLQRYNIVSMYIHNQTEKNWNRLVDYIRKHNLGKKQNLTIPFTHADCQELASGEEFHWTFSTDKGEDIDVYLKQEEESDFIDECAVCGEPREYIDVLCKKCGSEF